MSQRHLPWLLAPLVVVTACIADAPAPPPTDAVPSLRPAGDAALDVRDGATSPRTTTSLAGNRLLDAVLPDRDVVTLPGTELAWVDRDGTARVALDVEGRIVLLGLP